MQIHTIAICAAAIVLTACAVPLTDKAANIQVHSQMSTLLSSCQKLGPVSATSKAVWSQPTVETKVLARERVADLKGDTLVITNIDETKDLSGFTTTVHGTAMKCY